MQGIDISQEIASLREQIDAMDAAISRLQDPGVKPSGDGALHGASLGELFETRELMLARLSRLQSCKRTIDG